MIALFRSAARLSSLAFGSIVWYWGELYAGVGPVKSSRLVPTQIFFAFEECNARNQYSTPARSWSHMSCL